ncbi:MAG: putative peptidoglycan glycosyltransferase FtsW [Alphaproteobacteria bacterium]|nr:putative peptidoglycan glycosyltransferase FtsW [Alphaproteobacteria bacterium]
MSAAMPALNSVLGRWWWTVDRWVLAALIVLLAIGALLTMSAGPASAGRMRIDVFHFVQAQLTYLPLALAILLSVSLLTPVTVRRLAVVAFGLFIGLTALTLIFGPEIKGAQRWLVVFGQSLQPSEFVKPAFAVTAAWMFAEQRHEGGVPGNLIATLLAALVICLLVAQPDIGNALLVASVWFVQFFLAGLPTVWILALALLGLVGMISAYLLVDHVATRVNAFLDPSSADNYQIDTAIDAFINGGWFGRGPGEGTVKASLPDAHSDFILAVAGEELGILACIVIVALFAFIVLRGFLRVVQESDLFVMLSVAGLLTAFGVQALINMGSTLRMVPTKGITLPFISYGGSSLLALAFGMGMVLALTRVSAHRRVWP